MNFTITFHNSAITEFKGEDEIAELYRSNFFNAPTQNGKVIEIVHTGTKKIIGVHVKSNTCTRIINMTVDDLAYTCDINALNKKIDALAEQSHINDVQTFSMQDEFATITEVNDVLKNYVQIKDLPPTADLNNYYTKTESDNKYALKGETNSTSGRDYDDLTYKISQPNC